MQNRPKKATYTLSQWVLKEIVGPAENKSARVEELLIKGYMAEQKQGLNTEAKAAGNAEGLHSNLVRVGVQDLAFSGSKEDYLSGRFPVPIGNESWAEQYALGWPNKNLDRTVKLKVLGDKFV